MTFMATMGLPASCRLTMDRSYIRPYFRCMLLRSSKPGAHSVWPAVSWVQRGQLSSLKQALTLKLLCEAC